jgi:5,10-methylenetetrahydromethanopterin reductase
MRIANLRQRDQSAERWCRYRSCREGRMAQREIWMHAFPIPGKTVAIAEQAEAYGFDGLLVADSQNLVGDPYVEMGLAAKATQRLRLGTGNTNPITRHPAVTASSIATIQVESEGRAVLGIARGDSSVAWIGQHPAPVATLEQYVKQVQGFLRGEPVELDGFTSTTPWIARANQPKVPVDVAATGPHVIAVGARLAERVTFNVGAATERVQPAIQHARCQAGLDPDALSIGAYVNVATHPDVTVARNLVRGSVGIFAHFSSMPGFPVATLSPADRTVIDKLGEAWDAAQHGLIAAAQNRVLTDDFIDRFAVVGPAEHCLERLQALLALGLDRLVIVPGSRDADPHLLAETNERFATEVLPKLRVGTPTERAG